MPNLVWILITKKIINSLLYIRSNIILSLIRGWGVGEGVITRAFPGSELDVANTLAKWKKLEPNEINFSQCFNQKVVSTSCFVFKSLSSRGNFCCLLITFANSLDPDQAR